MDHISEISIENTVTVKIDYLIDQKILAKNFEIIMNCLKDLKSHQDNHSASLKQLSNLGEKFNQFQKQINQKINNNNNHNNSNAQESQQNNIQYQTSPTNSNNDKAFNNNTGQHHDNSNNHVQSSSQYSENSSPDFLKQIQQLKSRMSKNQNFVIENTKDITLLHKDMKDANEQIDNLKKQISGLKNGSTGTNGSVNDGNKNLSKNDNLQMESINNLNKLTADHDKLIKDLLNQIQKLKNQVGNLQTEIQDINTKLANDNNNTTNNQDNSANHESNNNIDSKSLSDLIKKLQYLTKKNDIIQNQTNNNSKTIYDLTEGQERNAKDIDELREDSNAIHNEIIQINKILQHLQKVQNNDNHGLLTEIEKLKDQYEKLLQMLKEIKRNSNESKDNADTSFDHSERQKGSSGKNLNRLSQKDKSSIRSDSKDYSNKLKQLEDRIRLLQKHLGDQNPQKLPSIAFKRPNQTSYNGQKPNKKQLSQIKGEIQAWVKNYITNNLKVNGGNMSQLQLRVQEIKNNLSKKADHEGMKKGLAFLQGKITQLYLFLTEPESEDAMIVRKGFNCLSCSKKVQTLRGKLGPRMNWDNLNNTNYNHTPPKIGFPKYADSAEKESI